MAPYPTRPLGKNGPQVSAIGFGAMGIGAFYGSSNEEEIMPTLTYAADRGVTFWDTSDIYGSSETVLGKWFKETGRRDEIFLCTKFGAMDLEHNTYVSRSDPPYIRREIERSLKALQTDHIDLYYQHRPDTKVPIEIVMETLKPYLESGTIRYVGLSECHIDDVKRAKAMGGIIAERFVIAQMEYSPFELSLEKSGDAEEYAKMGMSIAAYSPLSRGLVAGRFKSPDELAEDDFRRTLPRFSKENFPKNMAVTDKIKAVGEKYGATPGQIALAWILAEHDNFIPIPGCRNIARLEENAKAAEITLKPEDVKAIRELVEAADIRGERYVGAIMEATQVKSLPLSEWTGTREG